MNDKEQMINRFRRVKAMGWISSLRSNNTGIGKTFEEYAGVKENNIADADLFGFEIKAHREEASSYLTLCTQAPSFPRRANAYLLDKFGTPYEDHPDMKRLHTSIFANRRNTYENTWSFRLNNNRAAREIRIEIYHLDSQQVLDDTCGYTYDVLEKKFAKKLKNLFYVSAERRFTDGTEEFFFTDADIYTTPSFERFLDLVDDGTIMYDIRRGCYQSGKRAGKPHDHGSGFRILPKNLYLLYTTHEHID